MAHHLNGKAKLVGLLGYPISHSLSPQMHNTAFSHLGLGYAYLTFDTKEDNLDDVVKAMRVLNVKGFNVTMPNKANIIPLLDEVAPEAQWIGAVNTVLNDNGKLIGYNTDGRGYVQSLREAGIAFEGKRIVMAGAGGAGKAVAVQLAVDGAKEIVILDMVADMAAALSNTINEKIPSCKTQGLAFSDENLKEALQTADILVNCTPLGMTPHEDKSIIADPSVLRRELIVSDVVYKPAKTKLLKMAEAAGCRTINGFGMMIWQGAMAFKIWTGEDMPVDLVKQKFMETLGAAGK
ncbi:shikimate dehydrogenase [Anaerosolibacter carboniphilus]|uniref:Shikimate dehydrogenase (NADP(+)) n=1 Tax=Anaerosolibacter carboniphilus TaxID=1417629 RepID=A0A841KYQ3_9FIRM|nr:shikimate dehydrogenase [Anaerosolibacter carboniphilus]MBB6215269.1 shikimate dehydrogenase [Anaerosolibacter carboniphilus]